MKIKNYFLYKMRCVYNRMKVKNKNFTIISNDCAAGVIYHDLHSKFLSPTINLYIYPTDFVKFVKNLDYYLKCTLFDVTNSNEFPIGLLDDIKIYFMHYESFSVAKTKWDERCKRINRENIFIIFNDRNGATEKEISEIDKLKIPHIIYSNKKEYEKYTSVIYMDIFKNKDNVGIMTQFYKDTGKRYLYFADITGFINQKNNNYAIKQIKN